MTGSGDRSLPVKRVTGDTVAERLPRIATEHVLPARYLRREDGEVTETPAGMFERVATAVAAAEEFGDDATDWADRFETAMTDLAFVPNSPTLMNAGTDLGQLSACFVISPDDDLQDIFETVGDAATIFQSGGGVGYSFSRLRPRGDVVSTTGGRASGPVTFMTVFDRMCDVVRQGGRRRGAQMGVLRVDHPDVGRFVTAKRESDALTNFNVSVGVTDAFVAAVREDADYDLVNPRTDEPFVTTGETAAFYNESADPEPGHPSLWTLAEDVQGVGDYRGDLVTVGEPMTLPARLVWNLIVDGAWRNGEPGIFRIDAANREHSFDVDAHPRHRIEATNPCGEQPLEEYEACTLGHVNLSVLVREDAPDWRQFDGDVDDFLALALDGERLASVTRLGVRFLDDVTTVSAYPLDEIEATVAGRRKVGLGVMGFAELLLQLGIRYGSETSVAVADRVLGRIDRVATDESHRLAAERGSFPLWSESKYADPPSVPDWFRRHTGEDPTAWPDGYPIRNHGVTSVAPTGTTSMIAGTSPGIEPLYGVVYYRNVGRDVQGDRPLVQFDPYFLAVLDARGVDVGAVRAEARSQLEAGEYRGVEGLPVPDDLADLFVTAREVPMEAHVRIQAAAQAHVDGAVSKTVNLPAEADRETVEQAYDRAIEEGCLGCTVYRSGSRAGQVMSTDPGET